MNIKNKLKFKGEMKMQLKHTMDKCCGNCWWNTNGWCESGDKKIRVKKTDNFPCDDFTEVGIKYMERS